MYRSHVRTVIEGDLMELFYGLSGILLITTWLKYELPAMFWLSMSMFLGAYLIKEAERKREEK